MWIPFLVTGTAVETIRVGWVDVPVGAWRVDGSGIHAHQTDFVLYRHPQQARGTYLNAAPYSNYSLFYPPWGNIPLDPDVVANSESISAYWAVDLRTGIGTLAIFGGTQHLMSLTHAQVCLNYQVSQIVNREYGSLSTLMPVAAAAGNIIAGNYTAAGAGIEAQIGNAVAAKIPSATTIGSAGGLNSLNGTPALQYEFKRVVDIDSMNHGYPLCKCKVINELSGYVKVSNAYIEMIATQDERKAVTDYMEGGFFYE
jgi:hypothetical protein